MSSEGGYIYNFTLPLLELQYLDLAADWGDLANGSAPRPDPMDRALLRAQRLTRHLQRVECYQARRANWHQRPQIDMTGDPITVDGIRRPRARE